MIRKLPLAFVLAVVLAVVPAAAKAQVFTYSGFLRKPGGAPETAATSVNFRLWSTPTGGSSPVWAEVDLVTPGADGYFSVVLGATSTLAGVDFSAPLWLELQVGGEVAMTPRVALTDAPRALTVPFSGVTGFPATACSASQVVTGVGVDGRVTCAAKPAATSTGWMQVAQSPGGGTWGFNTGVGNFDLSAPGDTGTTWYAYVMSLDATESQHAAVEVYVDCTHSPASAGAVPQCRGATRVPFTRRVTNGANTFDLEFRYVFATDPAFAQWVMLVVAPRGVVAGSLDTVYLNGTYLPNLKFRGVVLSTR